MNNTFFTADTHFGHYNPKTGTGILKWTKRPFDTIEEHDTTLTENWNNTVSRKDKIYILGDFAWRDHMRYLSRLNGKKILILGNHDKMSQECYNQFTEVHPMLDLKINGKRIFLCHYPMWSWAGSCHCFKEGSPYLGHLFGHVHGRSCDIEKSRLAFDVGVDAWGLRPVSLDIVETKLAVMRARLGDRSKYESNVELIDNSQFM